MRFLRFLLSIVFLAGGAGLAVIRAAHRYNGDSRHIMIVTILCVAACMMAVAFLMRRFLPFAARPVKIAFFAAAAAAVCAAVTLRMVGIDGILPHRDGSQDVGIAALWSNLDLFILSTCGAALACRRCLAAPSASA
jgi:Kef-type K+ transport system membrane component KefB